MLEAYPDILVIGCGGSGGNTVSRLKEMGVEGAEMVAINTDSQDLSYTNADRKILIGRGITEGRGTGNDPERGRRAAEESREQIKEMLVGADLTFITCGLGGGTGSGAGPVVADLAKRMGSLVVGVLTLPFGIEDDRTEMNAEVGLKNFRKHSNSTILIPGSRLLEMVPDLSIEEVFRIADRLLADTIKRITEILSKPGLINLDFGNIKAILDDGGVAMVGFGESETEDRAKEAAEEALNNRLLEADLSNVDEALVSIIGGPDTSIAETETVAETVSRALNPDAEVMLGAQINKNLEKKLKVMIIAPRVETPWSEGSKERKKREEVEDALKDLKGL